MADAVDEPEKSEAWRRGQLIVITVVLALLLVSCLIIAGLFILNAIMGFDALRELIRGQFPAVAGVPVLTAVAFAVVSFLRQTEGPIEFEGLGFKFRGASGQVIMWVVSFLALTSAIKLLW